MYSRNSPWLLTNNFEYAMKWFKNPRQPWNRASRGQKPKAQNMYVWMGRDYFQLVTQTGSRSWYEKAQIVGRTMYGRYIDP